MRIVALFLTLLLMAPAAMAADPSLTYEQAFTACTEQTAAVSAGDSGDAVSACMASQGFTSDEVR